MMMNVRLMVMMTMIFSYSDHVARVLLIFNYNAGLLCSKAGHGLDDSLSLWHAL